MHLKAEFIEESNVNKYNDLCFSFFYNYRLEIITNIHFFFFSNSSFYY